MTDRRAYGTGSIYQDRRGYWYARVELPTRRGEPRRYRRMSSTTREGAEQRLADYHAEHPPRLRVARSDSMAAAKALGSHTPGQWRALVRSVGGRCYYCGVKTDAVFLPPHHPERREKDHKVPVTRGGSDSIDNIAVSCRRCNQEKRTMTADEFAEWSSKNA